MNNESLEGLRRKLQRRFERLDGSSRRGLFAKMKLLWEFIESEPLLEAIVNQLLPKETRELEHTAFSFFSIPEHFSLGGMTQAKTEIETATIAAVFVKACAVQSPGRGKIGDAEFRNALENCNAEDNEVRAFKTRFLDPLWDYFQDKLDDLQFLVGRILQYKQRCEWFERERLFELVEKVKSENPKQAELERYLKIDLYRYLHDQGITFFIDPFSYKAKIDLILDQTTERKTYIEVKVFDKKNRGMGEVRDGFGQLWRYLSDYNVTIGYLVVYNISDHGLVFKGEESESGVAVFRRGHFSIYAVSIEVFPHTTTASERKDQYVMMSDSDLPQSLDNLPGDELPKN